MKHVRSIRSIMGLLCFLLSSQGIETVRAFTGANMAVASTYRCMASGAEAPFFNPANLALARSNRFSLVLLGITGSGDNSAFSQQFYQRYNGTFLDENDKQKILDTIPHDGLMLHGQSTIQPISMSYGPFAASVSVVAALQGSIAKDIFSLIFRGNEIGHEYRFKPATGEGLLMAAYSFSGAHSFTLNKPYLQRFALGLNLKYLHGYAFGESRQMQARALTEFSTIRGDGVAQLRSALGGDGFCFDLGMAGEISEFFRVSLTIENIAAQIRWNKKSEVLLANFKLDATNANNIMENDQDIDEVVVHDDTTYRVSPFTTYIPTVTSFGIMYHKPTFSVAAQYEVGYDESALTTPVGRFSLGGEYRPWSFLPLRMGLALGGKTQFLFSYGFGLKIGAFRWDMGMQNVGGIVPPYSRGLGFATTFGFYF